MVTAVVRKTISRNIPYAITRLKLRGVMRSAQLHVKIMPIRQQSPLIRDFAQWLLYLVKSYGNEYPPDSIFLFFAARTKIIAYF
jgi:hypothetical protein